ncbi:F-box protein [Apostasia shenzhenica]|uniref:F-box protein n=1 Tax=Apostasia shenzhenica TaxID=1088818 RepID=A0A2I0AAA2_9ASPA|nr:F-box protein [Apostasia shenzhenica]
MPDEAPANPLHNFKLCGFLRLVVSIASPSDQSLAARIPPGAPCSPYSDRLNVGFRTGDGVLLLPIPECNAPPEREAEGVFLLDNSGAARKKGRRGSGGSMSVVHQLFALRAQRCVEIEARVVGVSVREGGDARAAVLVDVYLPVDVWCGWQFPKSGALAASLFKHVSCNWELRSSLLESKLNCQNHTHEQDEGIWRVSSCHVLGCEIHNNVARSGGKGLFDLHEIFKSLPGAAKEERVLSSRVKPENISRIMGIWDLSDDLFYRILSLLCPKELVRVAATCRHLRCLASSIIPCIKLKLFPHQEAAVEWMLRRENKPEVMPHPLFMSFSTVDGFLFYINAVSGKLITGVAPTDCDFRGGMFCDEPGLGKTVTALSLILKTHGILADPPDGAEVKWCPHDSGRRCGYYELGPGNMISSYLESSWKRFMTRNDQRVECYSTNSSSGGKVECYSTNSSSGLPSAEVAKHTLQTCRTMVQRPCMSVHLKNSSIKKPEVSSCTSAGSNPLKHAVRTTKGMSRVRRDILDSYEKVADCNHKRKVTIQPLADQDALLRSLSSKKPKKNSIPDSSDTWVQCDACRKWRKLTGNSRVDATKAWFCSMNDDVLHQNCAVPEESWDSKTRITCLPGFHTKGSKPGNEENVSFFTSVLKEHLMLLDFGTKKALTWLANLSPEKLMEMETIGITRADLDFMTVSGKQCHAYHKIFLSFGLIRETQRCLVRWYYPCALENLAFDSAALKIALTRPLDLCRMYLSGATLIVVPANLVEHWKAQIEKHVRPGQLRVYVWNDNKRPSVHNLAWDYDVVITTFSKLSAEWDPHKKSVLMQVHWLRVILDEGHTLGSSLSLTNKLQVSISLSASSRWILTGTPTPNTPNSQVAQLHPMLKFLHEETYGKIRKSWETGILKPFEARMLEGHARLVQLLRRIMISARKSDLKSIPPCIKNVTFLDFNEEHAKSYNELVLTARRNILMADWNDPSHVESLLNPKQWKFRSGLIKNLRLSCCVSGHIRVADAGQDIQETMGILVQQGLDPLSEEFAFIKIALLDGCSCFRCKDWCRLPVITPCLHLLCLDCVALDSGKCTYPGCNNPYEMQSPEKLTRPENPNPKWPVPKDLIELQPSYKQASLFLPSTSFFLSLPVPS